MKVQTFSIIVGTTACNAKCPFCVSKMTPVLGVNEKREINWRNFEKGCQFAKDSRVSTAMLTGKGEPLLYPEEITDFLTHLQNFNFPFIELQTNGILLEQQKEKYEEYLKQWYGLGLTTIAISIVHFEDEQNRQNYQPGGKYMNLENLISFLHEMGFSIRFSVIMFKGGIDSAEKVEKMIGFARKNNIEQLSLRELAIVNEGNNEIWQWTKNHLLDQKSVEEMRNFVTENGNLIMKLFHGAAVYDVDGQNVCLTNALTLDPNSEEIRQLIFFPDGHLRFDWQYQGAILI